jgi:lipopolysaccharide/colanic/teichoic acid biosynthesis glycosyltransferase
LENGILRGINLTVALVGLVLAAPLMALIAILVRLGSGGPALYVQHRVGRDRRGASSALWRGPDRRQSDIGGRPFRIYKFRTMRAAPEADEAWAGEHEDRITPLGALLRRHRLDELPQFLNVLKGDMNLVGPRPEQPGIFQELREALPHYPARQAVRPGITGWAQIHHRYDRDLEDVRRKVSYDLEYIRNRSVSREIFILWKTVPVMLLGRGAR